MRRFVKPSYDEFCAPTKKYADIIVPRGVENDVAINLIICHIQVLNTNFEIKTFGCRKKFDFFYLSIFQDILKSSGCSVNGNGVTNGDSIDQKRPH